jgi:hypothetical protein
MRFFLENELKMGFPQGKGGKPAAREWATNQHNLPPMILDNSTGLPDVMEL